MFVKFYGTSFMCFLDELPCACIYLVHQDLKNIETCFFYLCSLVFYPGGGYATSLCRCSHYNRPCIRVQKTRPVYSITRWWFQRLVIFIPTQRHDLSNLTNIVRIA